MEQEKRKLSSSSNKGKEASATAATAIHGKSSLTGDSSRNSDLNEQTSSFTLKFITWNIDGLHSKNLKARTEAVCRIIEAEQADIVFLQEVVPVTADYIAKRMHNYHCCFADEVEDDEDEENDDENESGEDEEDEDDEENDEDEEGGYFVGTLLKKSTVSFVDGEGEVIDFPLSKMSRHLLKINVAYKDLPICLLNSHLESLLKCSEERMNQLKIVFEHMLEAPENETVLFGGDTNLRDRELTELGGLPGGIEDVWVTCGSQKRYAYTFDTTENDNLEATYEARCRYDRVYLRRSSPPKLKPASFELIGLKRLSPYRCFPSDHWGVLCHFEKDNFRFKLDEMFSDNGDEVQNLQPYWMRKLRIHQ